jgi:ABC-type transport system involved in multi-copper enzyme maturation permease subunit
VKGAWKKLYLIELRRQWTVAAYFIPVALALLAFITLFTTAKFAKPYDATRQGVNINLSLVVPLATCLFAVGSIANDVKEGWLRTLLIRPISRQQYLLIKLAAVFTSVVVTILAAGILPNVIVTNFFVKGEVQFELGQYLCLHALLLFQALLYLAILMFFSCWVPGVLNVVVLGVWGMAASGISAYLQFAYWSNKWLTILKDYLFPSGFWDAIDAINAGMSTPVSQLAWGFAALGGFLALAFWSIAIIQVDKSSE